MRRMKQWKTNWSNSERLANFSDLRVFIRRKMKEKIMHIVESIGNFLKYTECNKRNELMNV